MMKKLLIFMLVLVLASAANAVVVPGSYTLYVSPTAQGPYTPGVDSEVTLDAIKGPTNLWIGVNNSVLGVAGATQMGSFMLGIGQPPVGPSDTSWTGAFIDFRPPLVAGAPVPANEYYGIQDMGVGVILDVWWLTLTDGAPASRQGVGVLDAKELQCDFGPSEDVIYLFDADDGTLLDTLIIHQVPEPVTIALLGLGGLLLRRRR
jgi:hypothetical protein